MFGAVDADDPAPAAWTAAREAADALEQCISDWFTAPSVGPPPVIHLCRTKATDARHALSALSTAITHRDGAS